MIRAADRRGYVRRAAPPGSRSPRSTHADVESDLAAICWGCICRAASRDLDTQALGAGRVDFQLTRGRAQRIALNS